MGSEDSQGRPLNSGVRESSFLRDSRGRVMHSGLYENIHNGALYKIDLFNVAPIMDMTGETGQHNDFGSYNGNLAEKEAVNLRPLCYKDALDLRGKAEKRTLFLEVLIQRQAVLRTLDGKKQDPAAAVTS